MPPAAAASKSTAAVIPSYLTTAEMLLLQLDMVGTVRQEAGQPTAVLGAGIPRNWFTVWKRPPQQTLANSESAYGTPATRLCQFRAGLLSS